MGIMGFLKAKCVARLYIYTCCKLAVVQSFHTLIIIDNVYATHRSRKKIINNNVNKASDACATNMRLLSAGAQAQNIKRYAMKTFRWLRAT